MIKHLYRFADYVDVDILLMFLTIFIRYKAEIDKLLIYTCTFSSLFIDGIFINFIDI